MQSTPTLPPLPEPAYDEDTTTAGPAYAGDQMRAYATAALVAQAAEIERLTAALAEQQPVGIVQALSVCGEPMPNSSGVEWLRPVPLGAKLYTLPPPTEPPPITTKEPE